MVEMIHESELLSESSSLLSHKKTEASGCQAVAVQPVSESAEALHHHECQSEQANLSTERGRRKAKVIWLCPVLCLAARRGNIHLAGPLGASRQAALSLHETRGLARPGLVAPNTTYDYLLSLLLCTWTRRCPE